MKISKLDPREGNFKVTMTNDEVGKMLFLMNYMPIVINHLAEKRYDSNELSKLDRLQFELFLKLETSLRREGKTIDYEVRTKSKGGE